MADLAAELIARHRATLERACAAVDDRDFWSPHPESPRAYASGEGQDAAAAGRAAFEALLGAEYPLPQNRTDGRVGPSPQEGGETSPYGFDLGISYPYATADALVEAAGAALPAWASAGPELRAAVCLEILARLNAQSPLIAHAVMHTSGQGFPMAFQAGGPHAQDRGLEAVAWTYREQLRLPASARWTKPQGKRPALVMDKSFVPVPRGVALVIGCNTFPTWNGYPGLFASLAAGNPVLVKPHPRAVLPWAITVRTAREVLTEHGLPADAVQLAAERPGERLARVLAVRPEVRLIDYTGSTAFGDWLEENAHQARVFTEKSAVNSVLIESTDDYAGMLANLAFSLSLYSGQMCTAPQNLLVPRDGVETDRGHRGYEEVLADLGAAVTELLADDAKASAILGALVNPAVAARVERAAAGDHGEVALAPRAVTHPEFPRAVVRTPVLVRADASDERPSRCSAPSGSARSPSSSPWTTRRPGSPCCAGPCRATGR